MALIASLWILASSLAAQVCSGCVLDDYQDPGSPVEVMVTFGPLTFSGSCTGEAAPCTASPCWIKTLKYTVTNPGANDIAFTGYTGSFPTPTATSFELSAGASVTISVGVAADPQSYLTCGGRNELVRAGGVSSGIECTNCP
jgi:hypothetical protein